MNQIEGYFLTFTGPETKLIADYLEERNCIISIDTLKELVLLACEQEDESEEIKAGKLRGFIRENPEVVFNALDTTINAIGKLIKKRPKKPGA